MITQILYVKPSKKYNLLDFHYARNLLAIRETKIASLMMLERPDDT